MHWTFLVKPQWSRENRIWKMGNEKVICSIGGERERENVCVGSGGLSKDVCL